MTITLEEKVARWARIRAAERDTSVSRLVGEMLKEKMIEEQTYKSAMEKFLSQHPRRLKRTGKGYPSREEKHAR